MEQAGGRLVALHHFGSSFLALSFSLFLCLISLLSFFAFFLWLWLSLVYFRVGKSASSGTRSRWQIPEGLCDLHGCDVCPERQETNVRWVALAVHSAVHQVETERRISRYYRHRLIIRYLSIKSTR